MMREIDARFYLLIFRRFTMGVLNIIFAIVLILTSVGVIALVSMQESKRNVCPYRRTVGGSWTQLRQNQRCDAGQRNKSPDRSAVCPDDCNFDRG